jgi:pyruvate/2-oxoacid:ferredoxin oxidoreductase beta subunit
MIRIKQTKGLRFLHILSSCPPGWKFPSEISLKISRLAVDTRIFPLYEIENGRRYRLTAEPKGKPVQEYLKVQGRFAHLQEKEVKAIQKNVDEEWDVLMGKMKSRGPKRQGGGAGRGQ